MPKYKLTHFNYTGSAEHIRYIFAYTGQPYEDVRINFEDWPAFKPSTPFGKLPFIEIDGKVVSQSNAIARYLAQQYGLTGTDEWEALQADVLVDTLADFVKEAFKDYYEKDKNKKAEIKKEFLEVTGPFYLQRFENIAAKNPSGLLVGSKVTWADLSFAHNLATLEESYPGVLKPYPGLTELVKKIHNIPSIKAWLEKRPPNPPLQS